MEKRIVGIIRWLERCLKAYKAGSLESAMLDMECARADIERLRDEVWLTLERRHSAKTRKEFGMFPNVAPLKGAVLALIAVLAAATPLALQQAESIFVAGRIIWEESAALEWVTPDERVLLGNLRKHLSDSNSYAEVRETAVSLSASVAPTVKRQEAKRDVLRYVAKEDAGVPYERIISLVKAGEKALKNEEPAIKIER